MSDGEYDDDDFETESPTATGKARRPSPRKTRGGRRPAGAATRGSRPSARDRLRAMNAAADKGEAGGGGRGSPSARDRLRAMNAAADRDDRSSREQAKGLDALVSAAGGDPAEDPERQTKDKRATDGGSARSDDEAALDGVDTGVGLSTMITSARYAGTGAQWVLARRRCRRDTHYTAAWAHWVPTFPVLLLCPLPPPASAGAHR